MEYLAATVDFGNFIIALMGIITAFSGAIFFLSQKINKLRDNTKDIEEIKSEMKGFQDHSLRLTEIERQLKRQWERIEQGEESTMLLNESIKELRNEMREANHLVFQSLKWLVNKHNGVEDQRGLAQISAQLDERIKYVIK